MHATRAKRRTRERLTFDGNRTTCITTRDTVTNRPAFAKNTLSTVLGEFETMADRVNLEIQIQNEKFLESGIQKSFVEANFNLI